MSNYKSTLQSNNTALSSNNLDLQSLIDQANALPDAGGVELPELTNEGTAADLISGKQLIDGEGNKVTGTFSIDSELNAQDSLIAQIQAAVDSLPEAGGGDENGSSGTFTLKIVVDTTYSDSILQGEIMNIYYSSKGQPISWEFDGMPKNEIVLEDVDINTYIIIDFGITLVGAPYYLELETSQNLYSVINSVLYYGTKANTVETISIVVG